MDDFDMFAVNLPDERLALPEMASHLAAEIRDTLPGGICFYSHCAGTGLALETALKLEAGGTPIQSFFIGASMAPLPLWSAKINASPEKNSNSKLSFSILRAWCGLTFDPWRYLSDAVVLKVLTRIGLPQPVADTGELWPAMLRIFRIDASQFYDFFRRRMDSEQTAEIALRLSCPIHCIVGENDPITHGARHKYRRWLQFGRSVDLSVIPGASHYFLSKQAGHLSRQIIDGLRKDQEGRHA